MDGAEAMSRDRDRGRDPYRLAADGSIAPMTQDDLLVLLESGEPFCPSVRRDELPDRLISTVFLRFDHGVGNRKGPVLWETMVFDGRGHVLECRRYTSHAAAITGHDRLVRLIRLGRRWRR